MVPNRISPTLLSCLAQKLDALHGVSSLSHVYDPKLSQTKRHEHANRLWIPHAGDIPMSFNTSVRLTGQTPASCLFSQKTLSPFQNATNLGQSSSPGWTGLLPKYYHPCSGYPLCLQHIFNGLLWKWFWQVPRRMRSGTSTSSIFCTLPGCARNFLSGPGKRSRRKNGDARCSIEFSRGFRSIGSSIGRKNWRISSCNMGSQIRERCLRGNWLDFSIAFLLGVLPKKRRLEYMSLEGCIRFHAVKRAGTQWHHNSIETYAIP